jgi:glycosyltransferase involved in cell wall biosynthesis
MKRVCIGVYFAGNLDGLRKTMARLRANTPRSAAVLLLVDNPDPVTRVELRAFPDVLQLPTVVPHGPAGCFEQLVAASNADICVFLSSGILVAPDWLAQMLCVLETDGRNGIVLADQSSLILVRRAAARAIGNTGPECQDPSQWIAEYCQKVSSAGFEIATAQLDIQQVHTQVTDPQPNLPTANHGSRDITLVPQKVNSWREINRSQHTRDENPLRLGSVSVAGHFNIASGYGSMSEYLVRGMSRAGARVNIVPMSLNPDGLSEEFYDLLRRSRKFTSDPVLFYSWPEPSLQQLWSHPELFIYTMWESSRLPHGWAEQINRARAVIVPTRFVADVFRESGVTSPIEVVPDGVDANVYHYLDRPERSGLTTLTVGPIDNRKNVRTGIAAWKKAFANDPDARLIIKTQYNYHNYVPDDARIRYVDQVESTRGIVHWYRQADVLLALGSEGFGLPLVEGMATGLPVIAMNSEGQSDVCADARDLLLPVAAESWEVYHSNFGSVGLHGVPGIGEVADRLRWVAEHRSEAREMGRAASQWVRGHRDVWTKGPAVIDLIERHSHAPRPFRPPTMLWTPSWQSRCGIAEYTAFLRDSLPSFVKVTAHQPDLRALRLLHVQHHTGIFHDSQLLGCVRHAKQAGVPVVVTEHAVDDQKRDWEQDATVIVVPHSLGARRIAARWPGKRVEYIPHGCPSWFPPRKVARGKVIGAFGFLADHKGFWRLLEILAQVPDAELLLFSHARSFEIEALWEKAAAGLPVHRVREYLNVSEIAHRLAAKADILAFWYDDVPCYSPSGAVRIALATGVPVLASPTQWFQDLQQVTYQPDNLVDGVRRLFDDAELRQNLTERARSYCHNHSWNRVADQHLALWRSLTENK